MKLDRFECTCSFDLFRNGMEVNEKSLKISFEGEQKKKCCYNYDCIVIQWLNQKRVNKRKIINISMNQTKRERKKQQK